MRISARSWWPDCSGVTSLRWIGNATTEGLVLFSRVREAVASEVRHPPKAATSRTFILVVRENEDISVLMIASDDGWMIVAMLQSKDMMKWDLTNVKMKGRERRRASERNIWIGCLRTFRLRLDAIGWWNDLKTFELGIVAVEEGTTLTTSERKRSQNSKLTQNGLTSMLKPPVGSSNNFVMSTIESWDVLRNHDHIELHHSAFGFGPNTDTSKNHADSFSSIEVGRRNPQDTCFVLLILKTRLDLAPAEPVSDFET